MTTYPDLLARRIISAVAKNHRAAHLTVVAPAVAALSIMSAPGLHGQLPELPPDPVATEYVTGVAAEIPIVLQVDRALIESSIPDGFCLQTGPGGATVYLLVIVAESIVVNDVPLQPATENSLPAITSLWAMIDEPGRAYDPRVRGSQPAVELGTWYPDSAVVAELNASGIAAEFGETVATLDGDLWRFEVRLPDGIVRGTCRLQGEPYDLGAPPGYQTIWHAGPAPSVFTLYAYRGHHGQRCSFEVEANGTHPLAELVRDAGGSGPRPTVLQHSWTVRGGMYRR